MVTSRAGGTSNGSGTVRAPQSSPREASATEPALHTSGVQLAKVIVAWTGPPVAANGSGAICSRKRAGGPTALQSVTGDTRTITGGDGSSNVSTPSCAMAHENG